MRGVVQRVKKASVSVNEKNISQIGNGLLILVGFCKEDTVKDINYFVEKSINLRIFSDENNNLNLSLIDIKGELLIVSQFTLFGDCRKGRRPSFSSSMPPKEANTMFDKLIDVYKSKKVIPKTGIFQSMMDVELINDGPVTLLIDSKKNF